MERAIVILTCAVIGTIAGCAQHGQGAARGDVASPKVTREYLIAHGFQREAGPRDIYELETVHLADVLRDLGLSLASLQPTPNMGGDEDFRGAWLGPIFVLVESQVARKPGGNRPLDEPDARCKVRVSFNERPPQTHRGTESTPRMRIKAVTVPQDASKPLQVAFELSAEGEEPVVVDQSQFSIGGTYKGQPPQEIARIGASFSHGTPEQIRVLPGKPVVLSLTGDPRVTVIRPGERRRTVSEPAWSELAAGEYAISVEIHPPAKADGPKFDYQWMGTQSSDEYKFIVKERNGR